MAVTMTDAAIKRVRTLCKKRQTPDAVLRVGVRGGGCSGLSYFMDFVEQAEEKDKIFECFVKALEEDPAQVRADAAELAAFAEGASGADALAANPVFAEIKALGEKKKFAYSRYDAVGVFRMLELAGAADPAALESLVGAAGLQLKKVNGDLGMYKGLLSKLAAAKELQAEIFEREKRKTAEREAKKAEKAAAAEKKDE